MLKVASLFHFGIFDSLLVSCRVLHPRNLAYSCWVLGVISQQRSVSMAVFTSRALYIYQTMATAAAIVCRVETNRGNFTSSIWQSNRTQTRDAYKTKERERERALLSRDGYREVTRRLDISSSSSSSTKRVFYIIYVYKQMERESHSIWGRYYSHLNFRLISNMNINQLVLHRAIDPLPALSVNCLRASLFPRRAAVTTERSSSQQNVLLKIHPIYFIIL